MGKMNPIDMVSDAIGMMTFGTFDVKKMRMYVPLSPGAFRNFGKQTLNFATMQQLRPQINEFGDSPIARGLATVASATVLTLGTAGVASSLMAPASTVGGITGTGGTVAPLAAEGGSGMAALVANGGTIAPIAGTGTGTVAAGATGLAAPALTKVISGVGTPAAGSGAEFTSELAEKTSGLNGADTKGWFASLSPGAQTALVTSGLTVAQMATGAMGGIFQGVSAQKKLELEKLINSQNETQRQRLNTNQEYAPDLKFQPRTAGMVSA